MVISLFLILIGFIILTYCSEIGEFLKPGSQTTKQVIFISSYLFVIFSGNALQTPARSICSDVTPIHQQNLMANICSVFAGLGGFIVNIVGGLKLEKLLHIDQLKFILIVSAVFCTISVLVTVFVTHEEPLLVKPPKIHLFGEIFKSFKVMPRPMARVLPSLLLSTMANFQFSFEFNHFMGKDVFHGDNSASSSPEQKERYEDGITWSMLCGAVRYGSQFLYGLACTKISERIGFKWASFVGYMMITVALSMFFFVRNKFAYLAIVVGPGIGYGTAFSVPYAVAAISAALCKQDIGIYFGMLIVFTVIGEQCSNLLIGSLLGLAWPDNPRMMIAISSVVGVMASVSSLWIVEPDIENRNEYASLASSSENLVKEN